MRFLNPREEDENNCHTFPTQCLESGYIFDWLSPWKWKLHTEDAPLNIYGSILTQRGKKTQKSDIFNLKMSIFAICTWQRRVVPFHIVSCLRLRPPYVLAPCICAVPTCVHVYVRAHRARMYAPTRARSNRNVVFLLSQVSHQGRNRSQNSRFLGGRWQNKTALFQVLSTEFEGLEWEIC